MVHLSHTAANFAAMGYPVLLPIAACATPTGAAIRITNKNILAVETLETWAVGISDGHGPICLVPIGLEVVPSGLETAIPLPPLLLPVLVLDRRWTQWHNAGVELDSQEDSEIGEEHHKREDDVEGDEAGRYVTLTESVDIEVDYMYQLPPVSLVYPPGY